MSGIAKKYISLTTCSDLTLIRILATTGRMAPECNRVTKRLAEKIAEKRREPYASVITYIRTKLRFALLRSTLAAIRGFQGKRSDVHLKDLTDIDFSLIPRPTVT